LPLFINFLHFQDDFALLSVGIIHIGVKEAAYLLVVVLQTLQDQKLGDDEEDLRVPLLQLLEELSVLLRRGFNHLAEV